MAVRKHLAREVTATVGKPRAAGAVRKCSARAVIAAVLRFDFVVE